MITIIGAGPGGSYTAYLLAKKGADVKVFEEHPDIGEPVACTGIITGIIADNFKPPNDIIVNRIEKARIFAPNNEFVDVKLKNDLILDRAKLDRHLANLAREAGAKYFLNRRFMDCEKSIGKWKVKIYNNATGDTESVATNILIGADGALSRVAKTTGMYGERKFYAGMQVTADVENEGFIEFYPYGKNIAWVVPEGPDRARIGVAAVEKPDIIFREFMEKRVGKNYEKSIVNRQAGLIPLYNPKIKTFRDNAYLVGDAATTAKASTLGGINQSMIGAISLAEAILSGKDYDRLWRKKMGRDLHISLLMRKVMNKFRDEDYNQLVRIFQKEKNRKLLENFERDAPSRFFLRLIIQEPALWKFSRYLF